MKLSRTLVIERLESKLTAEKKAREKKLAEYRKRSEKAVKAASRIRLSESPTIGQIERASDLLHEAKTYHPEYRYSRYGGNFDEESHYERQIRREIELLKLSTDAEITIRNNSSLADFLA